MGLDKSMAEVWSQFSVCNCGADKSVFETQEIQRFAVADLAIIFSTESELFSEKVSKVFYDHFPYKRKKDLCRCGNLVCIVSIAIALL